MENYSFLDSENWGVGDKPKGEKLGKRSTVGTMPRKRRLTDISNLQRPKPSSQVDKPQPGLVSTKEYIDQLQKENAVLRKLLADRNKIIELSGIELQKLQINLPKLQINLQKLQQQNLQLAQANSHMLVKLNSGKDRLKVLHHELGCKNGLIEALKIVSQGKAKTVTCQKCGDKFDTLDGTAGSSQAEKDDGNPDNTNMRLQSKNQTLRHSGKQDKAKEKTENKRRRQSARFKPEEPKPNEDLFKIDDVIFPVCPLRDECMHDSGPTSSGSDVKEEDQGDCAPGSGVEQSRRSSIGRPQRRAAEKIKSYKEIPLNVKMYRKEDTHDSGPTSSGSEVKEEDQGDCAPGSGVEQSRRSSIGRPQRRAAEKIKSYKEIPLNVKMYRKEDTHDSGPTSSGSEVKEEDQGDCAPGSGVEQSRRSSIGRPQRRAAENIKSYKEIPLNVKMRQRS